MIDLVTILENINDVNDKYRVQKLPLKYKSIHLTNQDIIDKLKIVRLLLRTLHTYQFESAIEEREYFNKIIGIYQ